MFSGLSIVERHCSVRSFIRELERGSWAGIAHHRNTAERLEVGEIENWRGWRERLMIDLKGFNVGEPSGMGESLRVLLANFSHKIVDSL